MCFVSYDLMIIALLLLCKVLIEPVVRVKDIKLLMGLLYIFFQYSFETIQGSYVTILFNTNSEYSRNILKMTDLSDYRNIYIGAESAMHGLL